jgi:hypothetical protein
MVVVKPTDLSAHFPHSPGKFHELLCTNFPIEASIWNSYLLQAKLPYLICTPSWINNFYITIR